MDQTKLMRSDYVFFLVAIAMLIVYIFIYPQIFPKASLKLKLTETQISQQANQILEDLGYNTDDFTHRLTLRQNREQIRYLQKQFNLRKANDIIKENLIPVYFWKIDLKDKSAPVRVISFSYDSEEEAKEAVEKALSDTISLSLNVVGELIQLQARLGEKDQIDTLSYEEALTLANSLLKKIQPERFHLFKLTSSIDESRLWRIEHNFTWENSQPVYGETETIKMSVYGNFINKYQAIFTPPKDVIISSSKSELKAIPVVIALITIVILFIVLLIKKLKKDEIELRSNVVLSVLVTLGWMLILVNNIQFSEERALFAIIISVIVTSPFVFIGFLIVSSISESSARDVWEEKLLTFDALKKRTILFPQFSLSIFRGLALAFLAAGLLTLLLKIGSFINNYYMDFEDSNLTAKFSFLPVVYVIAVAIMRTGFYEFIFRMFFVSTFRRKVNRSITIIILCALIAIFSYGGYADLKISPYYLNLVINFFIAVLFIASFIKWDFMTVWIGALGYYLLRELYPMTFFDNGFLMWNGISTWIIFGIFVLLGIIGYCRKVDIREIQRYIPSYVIRREERERMQREFEIARRVQFSFLPREKPKLKGIDLASICIPAMEVGGDYYDFIELDDHCLGVVIGDVSGKGISAAFHMTLTKGFLKSQAKSGLSPRQIMINLNELFYENVERGTFISMIYGIFDLQGRTFTFSRAGHNPLLIQKGMDEKVEILCPKGLALGLEKGTLFERVIEEYTIGVHSDDIFVFYTDGFSEAMNNKKEEFGEDRLQKLLQKNSLPSAEHIINHIKTEIINFVGDAPQHDDMTMLVVKIL
jgi:sigma-B regulation protein RsbU (phosphoserine phosphatase)